MDRLEQSGFYHILTLIYMLIHNINTETDRQTDNEGQVIAVCPLLLGLNPAISYLAQ